MNYNFNLKFINKGIIAITESIDKFNKKEPM